MSGRAVALDAKDSALVMQLIQHAARAETSVEKLLQKGLELVCNAEWLSGGKSGSVFYAVNDQLHMAAQYRLSRQIRKRCAHVSFGCCLCGQVAKTQAPLFCAGVDERHEIRHRAMPDHGHYILPLIHRGNMVGVLNIYTEAGHAFQKREKAALEAVADIFALLIATHRGDVHRLSGAGGHAAEGERQSLRHAFSLLLESGRSAVTAVSEATLLDALPRAVVESGGYAAAWVGLIVSAPSLTQAR